jgi:hypothetical protein|tara:strand:+ start:213 stop:386 length:174 start_codon:yes stop_codon:yes gene_type:complete
MVAAPIRLQHFHDVSVMKAMSREHLAIRQNVVNLRRRVIVGMGPFKGLAVVPIHVNE